MRKRVILFLAAFLILRVIPGAAQGSSGEMSVEARVNKAFITIGEEVTYEVKITHSPDVQVLSGISAPPKDVFKIKKIEDIQQQDGDLEITGKRYVLTTFRLGEFILNPVKIKYRIGGGDTQEIETERIFITVESVAGEGDEKADIRGIKPVVPIEGKLKFLFWILAGSAMLILAIFLFIRLRKRAEEGGAAEVILTLEEKTLLDLNSLYDSPLLKEAKIKEYYFRMSEILKNYLEKRFSILALESTTFEILRDLKRIETDMKLRELVKEVFEFADLAKYAKWKPEPTQIVAVNKKAREIVETAAPRPEPEGEEHKEVESGV